MENTVENMSEADMDEWFGDVRIKLNMVAAMRPRCDYLHPVMRRVPFQDLETDLDCTILKFKEEHAELFTKMIKDAK